MVVSRVTDGYCWTSCESEPSLNVSSAFNSRLSRRADSRAADAQLAFRERLPLALCCGIRLCLLTVPI